MTTIRSFVGTSRRVISSRLDRLRDSLRDLRERLRATVVQILGDNLARMIRETVQESFGASSGPAPYPSHRSTSWEDPDDYYWGSTDPTDPWEEETHSYEENHQARASTSDEPPSKSVSTALASGLRAVAWGLRRWSGTGSLARIAGCGFVVACAAYFFGSFASIGLSLMEATDHLSTLG